MQFPPPPPPPDNETRLRWLTQGTTARLLLEDYGDSQNDVVQAWMEEHLGSAAQMVGPPDISANTLTAAAQQFATPGLYGLSEPLLAHLEGHRGLVRALSGAGYWTKMQFVQKMVFGLGSYALALDVADGRLLVRHARPWQIYTRCDPSDATRLLELRELRLAKCPDGTIDWFWWCYQIDDEPTFLVLDSAGNPASNLHILVSGEYAPPGGLRGEAYPYRYKDGTPFIPYAFYKNSDSGDFWDLSGRRGARVGALNAITMSTFGLRGFFGASAPPTVAINLQKPSGNQRGLQQATNLGDPGSSESIPIVPGSMLFLQENAEAKGSPSISTIQSGANLQAMQTFLDAYTSRQFSLLGLASDQLARNSANPTSAASLTITASAKRMLCAMHAPYFRLCDLAAVKMVAALLRLGGIGDFPEDGWSITYSLIPLSPDEQQAIREQEDHDRAAGLLSAVDLWTSRNPGQSEEEAMAHLVRIQVQDARLKAAIDAALKPIVPQPEPAEPPEELTAEMPEEPSAEMPAEPESSEESSSEEMPMEDDTSEEAEMEAIATVAAELEALEEILPIDAEGAEVDIPAIRASIADIRTALGIK